MSNPPPDQQIAPRGTRNQHLGQLCAGETGTSLLPPRGQAPADSGRNRSTASGYDVFAAGQARAAAYEAAYQAAAGGGSGNNGHKDEEGSYSDSSCDIDVDGTETLELSPATRKLLSPSTLAQVDRHYAPGQRRTTAKRCSTDEHDGDQQEAGGRQDAPDLHAEEDEDDDFAVNGRSHQVTAGATPPPPPPPPPCLPPLRAPSSTTSAMAAASTASGSGRVPTQGPSIGRPPPSSPTRDATAAAGGDVRTEKPSFNLWGLADLKAEAIRQAGRRKGLKFGPLPGDEVRQISNANRPDLIHALVARMAWRERLNLEPEWSGIRLGVTPEKRKRKQEKIIAKAKKLAGGGVGKKQPRVAKNQGYVCRLVCLTLLEEFYDEYLRSRGGEGGTGRSAQDAKEVNERHRFYFLVARAMATVGWKDRNGNVLSVPDDHSTDERAPENLKSLLGNLDLEGAAVSLQEELQTVYQGDADAFHAMLQVKCYEWLKETRSHHTQFKANELQSGGAGADEGEDGNPVDAIHASEFMGGRVATMIWEDGVRLRGGDDTNESGSAIIPDGQPGAGSSVPGGPGVRGAVSESAAPSSGKDAWGKPKSAKPKSIRKGRQRAERAAHGEERAVLVSKANGLLDMLSKSAEQDAKTADPAFRSLQEGRSKDLAIEELIGDVDRLQRKVDSATSDKARERFQKLLDRAEARLDLADAENEKDEASAAASSSAAASPTASRPHAPSTPAAAGGGASAGGMPSGHVSSAAAASPTTSLPRAGGGPTDPLPIEELPAIRRALEGLGGDEGL